jgi:Tol biopolymer transport system component
MFYSMAIIRLVARHNGNRRRRPKAPEGAAVMRVTVVLASLVLALVLCIPSAAVGAVKLGGPPAGPVILDFQVSPDSKWVVFLASEDGGTFKFELFSSPVAGGTPVKLNPPMPMYQQVGGFSITPDSSRVVFGSTDLQGHRNVYCVPIEGGEPLMLNPPLAEGRNAGLYTVTPDGTKVVYVCNQERRSAFELYVVNLDGSGLKKLNGPLVNGGSVADYVLSPDGSRLVYVADALTDDVFECFGVSLSGSNAVRLNAVPKPGAGALAGNPPRQYAVSPDNSRAVYIADHDTLGRYELYSASAAGGSKPVKLNGPMPKGGSIQSFVIDDVSSRVIYRADQDEAGVNELYSVPLAGGEAVKLNPPPMGRGEVFWYILAPDGERVVFTSGRADDLIFQLFSANTTGGGWVALDAWLPVRSWALDFHLSPDGQTVVYRAGQAEEFTYDLYSVPTTGGELARLVGPLPEGEFLADYDISPTGDRVLCLTGPLDGEQHLYSLPIGGGTPKLVDPSPVATPGLTQRNTFITPDGQSVIFVGDPENDGVYDLYSAPLPPL